MGRKSTVCPEQVSEAKREPVREELGVWRKVTTLR